MGKIRYVATLTLFCIGVLGEEDDAVRQIITSKMSTNAMTMRDYFGDSLGFTYYYRHPRNYSRRAIFSIDEPAPTMRGVNLSAVIEQK